VLRAHHLQVRRLTLTLICAQITLNKSTQGYQFALLENIHHQLVPKATGFQKENCRVVWEGGSFKPFSSILLDIAHNFHASQPIVEA